MSSSTTGRDARGHFTKGNTVARSGWDGLVKSRFNGNYEIAKAWLEKVGRYGYGRSYYDPRTGSYPSWVKNSFRTPPPSPEEFTKDFNAKLDFTLSDVGSLGF